MCVTAASDAGLSASLTGPALVLIVFLQEAGCLLALGLNGRWASNCTSLLSALLHCDIVPKCGLAGCLFRKTRGYFQAILSFDKHLFDIQFNFATYMCFLRSCCMITNLPVNENSGPSTHPSVMCETKLSMILSSSTALPEVEMLKVLLWQLKAFSSATGRKQSHRVAGTTCGSVIEPHNCSCCMNTRTGLWF